MAEAFLGLLGIAAVFVVSLPGIALGLWWRAPKRSARSAFALGVANGLLSAVLGGFFMLSAAASDEHGLSLLWLAASALIPFALSFVWTFVFLRSVYRRRADRT